MKKLLFFLLLIPTLLFGQMRIESHKQELYKGVKLNYKVYLAPVPTNNWVLFLHGSGECGAADGSQLNDVEINGLAKYARTNTYKFNILAPQATCSGTTSNWSVIRWVLLDLVKEQYKAQKIIVTGLSQGGMEAVDWGFRDKKGYVDGIAVMCGKTSSNKNDIPRDTIIGTKTVVIAWRLYRNIPYLGIHGDKDTGVSYYDGKKVYTGIISASGRTAPATFLTIPGGNHASAWTRGYSSDPADPYGKKFFEFTDIVFSAPAPIRCDAVLDTLNRTATFFLPGDVQYKAIIIKQ